MWHTNSIAECYALLVSARTRRRVRLPTDAEDSSAAADIVSLSRTADPTGLSPTGTEAGLHRAFTTSTAGTYELRASAVCKLICLRK